METAQYPSTSKIESRTPGEKISSAAEWCDRYLFLTESLSYKISNGNTKEVEEVIAKRHEMLMFLPEIINATTDPQEKKAFEKFLKSISELEKESCKKIKTKMNEILSHLGSVKKYQRAAKSGKDMVVSRFVDIRQ